jgi:hypothetical protein
MNWMSYHAKFWNERMNNLEKHLIEKRKRGGK